MADSENTRTVPADTTPTRRRLLAGLAAAPAALALPALAGVAPIGDDAELIAAFADYVRATAAFNALHCDTPKYWTERYGNRSAPRVGAVGL
jgi:hypothetical protein